MTRLISCLLALLCASAAWASPIFYGGDWNESGCVYNNAIILPFLYDDFELTETTRITSIFVNQVAQTHPATADFEFEIRTGPMVGTGGTTLFSHTGITDSITPTGRSFAGQTESTFRENDIDLVLPAGIYWLHVEAGNNPYIAEAEGLNSYGSPINNGSVIYDPFASQFWEFIDFDSSFGFDGHVVPEPSSIAAISLLLLGTVGKRSFRKKVKSPFVSVPLETVR